MKAAIALLAACCTVAGCMRAHLPLHLLLKITPRAVLAKPSLPSTPHAGGNYEDVGMQCVSEFNWNQGTQSTYKSATGYFVGDTGNRVDSAIPDCAGGWSAHNDTLILKGNKQPRMFLKDATGTLIMLDMASEDVSWTQNVAQLGRFFNGALYCPPSPPPPPIIGHLSKHKRTHNRQSIISSTVRLTMPIFSDTPRGLHPRTKATPPTPPDCTRYSFLQSLFCNI
jgi:hypothetical protein